MKFRLALVFLISLFPAFSFGQSCLTILSEDGEKFYLLLNGVKQNPMPQANVRVDGLTSEYYSAKLLFDNPAKTTISKNIDLKKDAGGRFQETTYKIKRSKDGALKLRFYGATPVPANYVAPPGMYVKHFGQTPDNVTPTEQGKNGTVSLVIGGGNQNDSDPTMSDGVPPARSNAQTTVTDYGNNVAPHREHEHCKYAMDRSSFSSAKETISKASFEETKLSTAKAILSSNCVSSDQVAQICNLFNFEASKLEFAKFAYLKTTDKRNYFKVNNVFSFDASKTDLNNYVSGQGQ